MIVPLHNHCHLIFYICENPECERFEKERLFLEDKNSDGTTRGVLAIPDEFCRICLHTLKIKLPSCCLKAVEEKSDTVEIK